MSRCRQQPGVSLLALINVSTRRSSNKVTQPVRLSESAHSNFTMPPKRKALESVSPNIDERSNGKKTKTGAAAAAAAAAQQAPLEPQPQDPQLQSTIKRRQKRWAEVSGSKNLDIGYQIAMQDPRHAYESICICNPLQGRDDEDDDDDDASDKEDEAEDDGGASVGKND
ncbi:hypothetical protein J3459_015247 [Metarhizium acridum]|nr:hypothetical protein J3459_015247 [Metarhizium acridum]